MHLYVANLTNQTHEFTYRFMGEPNYRQERIEIGRQICIPIDLNEAQLADIIKQRLPFGFPAVRELADLRTHVGLCYSIDKPVPIDHVLETFENNKDALNQRAVERREETAAAIASGITDNMKERGVTVPRTEIEFVDTESGKIAEGYEITQPGVKPRYEGKKSRRARASA